ncbi:hypothetical protein PTI98_003900 [Pleurotus ostreatus]|nr:hypothetical protein PTI98_003900 [Pleurotus ostreatus]
MPNRSSGLDFSDGAPAVGPDVPAQPSFLQRNKTERRRLQGLQRTNSVKSPGNGLFVPTTFGQKFNLWMINEGGRQLFFGVWIFLHILVAVFGFFHYQMKDNLNTARSLFGYGFTIARTAALVLHIDVIFILLPVCRNFISFLRRTP